MRFLSSIPIGLLLIAASGEEPASSPPARAGAKDPTLVEGSYRVLGEGSVGLWIPPGESLEFEVEVDLGLLGHTTAGMVTMSSGLESFLPDLPRPGEALSEGGPMVPWIRVAARGGYLGYKLDHVITTRFLPQEWPSMASLEVNSGTSHRKREIKIGVKDGVWRSSYRGNSHCDGCTRREHFVEGAFPWSADRHCNRCKRAEHRLWNPIRERGVPAHTEDVLGAVYLARNLIRSDETELELFMVQKDNLWKVKLRKGEARELTVPAGTFACREVRLQAIQPPGERKKRPRFSGLFGIRGELRFWFHEGTGVPIRIDGDVPVGNLFDLRARIELSTFHGTPAAFKAR